MATARELLKDDQYQYNSKQTPKYNYECFQQAISFGQGVEFLKTSSFSNQPMLVLLNVPGLSIDLLKAEALLNDFNQKLLDQLDLFIDGSKNQYEIFAHFYELYKSVKIQQEEYKMGRDQFFASAIALKFSPGDIKALKLPFKPTRYNGIFQEMFQGVKHEPVLYNNIGTEGKKDLEQLYLLKRRYNMNLLKDLTKLKTKLFREKSFTRQYKYHGEIADLLEVALALIRSKKMKQLERGEINEELFAKDFCLFLGRTFSSIKDNRPTINKRLIENNTFLKKSNTTISEA
jgi:hypothetical protein